jgi:hypothetical protein
MEQSTMKLSLALIVAAAVALAAPSAHAVLIYGSATTNGTGALTVFDTTTATTTSLATVPGNMGLSFDANDNLWGISQANSQLYSIDTTTGVATAIGTGNPSISGIEGVTFDLSGRLLATGGNTNAVYQMDLGTGILTQVGSYSGLADVDGLSVAPVDVATANGTVTAGTIFVVDTGNVYTLDPTTFVATSLVSNSNAQETIAFGADGTMYTNSGSSGEYYTLDLTSGATTALGGPPVWGSAVQGALVSNAVPAPGTLALLALGLPMLSLLRRGRAAV